MNIHDNFDGEILDTYLELAVTVSYDVNSGTYDVYLGSTKITNEIDAEILAGLESDWDEANDEHNDNDQFADGDNDPYRDRGLFRRDFV